MLEANQGGDLERISEEFTPITLKTEENTYWKDYEYGGPIQKLRPGIEVQEIQQDTNFYINHSSRGTGGTGNQTITGVGFRPSKVKIRAFFTTSPGASSDGHATNTGEKFTRKTEFITNYRFAVDSTNIVSLYVDTGGGVTQAQATLSSFDEDGFTLNWTSVGATVLFGFECYK